MSAYFRSFITTTSHSETNLESLYFFLIYRKTKNKVIEFFIVLPLNVYVYNCFKQERGWSQDCKMH